MKKRAMSIILTVVMLFSMLATATPALAAETATSGTWGSSGGTWSFNEATGTLTVSGSGEIPDYVVAWDQDCPPWLHLRDKVVSVVVGEGITRIGDSAFGSTYTSGVFENLTNVTLPSTLKSIGEEAFANAALTSISLPAGLLSIENSAFDGCPIRQVSLPSKLTSIGSYAFTGLTAVHIPASVKNIGSRPFGSGAYLQSITVAAGSQYFTVVDNVLYNKAKTEIIHFASSTELYSIPDTVETVDLSIFWRSDALTGIIVPANVELTSNSYWDSGGVDLSKTFSIYFCGDAPENLENWEMYRLWDIPTIVSLSIYYAEGTKGWDTYINQNYWDSNSSGYRMTFHTWTPDTESGKDCPIVIIPGIMGSRLFSDADCTDCVWTDGITGAIDAANAGSNLKITNTLYVKSDIVNTDNTCIKLNGLHLETSDDLEYGTKDCSKTMVDYLWDQYGSSRDIYFYSYDWRQSNEDSAEKLKEDLDALGITKADFICHSMGGLVASQFVSACDGEEYINNIITLGTPYEGAPKLLNAVLTTNVLDSAAGNLLLSFGGLNADVKSTFKGVAELAPTVDYWNAVTTNKILGPSLDYGESVNFKDNVLYPEKIPENLGSEQLKYWVLTSRSFEKLKEELSGIYGEALYDCAVSIQGNEIVVTPIVFVSSSTSPGYEEILNSVFNYSKLENEMQNVQSAIQVLLGMTNAYFAVGNTTRTMTGVTLVVDLNGKVSFNDADYGLGDGTVPYTSATMLSNDDAVNFAYFDLDHGDFFNLEKEDLKNGDYDEWCELAEWVTSILDSGSAVARTTPTKTSACTVIRIACPVDVEIEKGDEILTNIAEKYSDTASFGVMDLLGTDGDIKMFCLDDDDYSITLTGSGEGTMDYAIRFYSAEGKLIDERTFYDVPITESTIITTDSTRVGATELEIDEDGDGTIDEVLYAFNHLIDVDEDSSTGSDTDTPSVSTAYSITVKDTGNGTIEVSAAEACEGDTVTITVTPDRYYTLASLVVTDSKGREITVKDNGDGAYTFTMPASKVMIEATFELDEDYLLFLDILAGAAASQHDCLSAGYTDLDASLWYHEAVDYVLETGLMTGYSSTTFAPGDTMTRAMLAQILYNQAGRPAVTGTSGFTDVAADAWYADAVIWASAQGCMQGYGDGTFGAADAVTREQLAAVLYRQAGSPAASGSLDGFADGAQVSAWARPALLWATSNGVVNGSGGSLNPCGSATRAEVAQMLFNHSKLS